MGRVSVWACSATCGRSAVLWAEQGTGKSGGGSFAEDRVAAEQKASTTERGPVREALLCVPSHRAKCVMWPQVSSLQTTLPCS